MLAEFAQRMLRRHSMCTSLAQLKLAGVELTLLMCMQFTTTLESNIFKLLNALANVTIDSVVATSVSVTNTVAFTGSDSTQASAAAAALVTALNSGDTAVFGNSFGDVTVSGVTATNATNPGEFLFCFEGQCHVQYTPLS